MQSKATSVSDYLVSLPPDRRAAIEAIRTMILENMDSGFEEGMQYGMIGYYVPHSLFPAGYHCDPKQPLPFAGLASQKNHMSLYVMSLYSNESEEKAFREEWAKSGKKLDMGKCCIRFKKLDDFAMDVMKKVFKRTTAKKYIKSYLDARENYAASKNPRAEQSRPTKKVVKANQPAKSTKKAKKSTTAAPRKSSQRRK